jgi:uridine kinase
MLLRNSCQGGSGVTTLFEDLSKAISDEHPTILSKDDRDNFQGYHEHPASINSNSRMSQR